MDRVSQRYVRTASLSNDSRDAFLKELDFTILPIISSISASALLSYFFENQKKMPQDWYWNFIQVKCFFLTSSLVPLQLIQFGCRLALFSNIWDAILIPVHSQMLQRLLSEHLTTCPFPAILPIIITSWKWFCHDFVNECMPDFDAHAIVVLKIEIAGYIIVLL